MLEKGTLSIDVIPRSLCVHVHVSLYMYMCKYACTCTCGVAVYQTVNLNQSHRERDTFLHVLRADISPEHHSIPASLDEQCSP